MLQKPDFYTPAKYPGILFLLYLAQSFVKSPSGILQECVLQATHSEMSWHFLPGQVSMKRAPVGTRLLHP